MRRINSPDVEKEQVVDRCIAHTTATEELQNAATQGRMLVMMPTMRKSRGVMRAILAVLIALLAVPSGIAAEAASQQQITTAVEALTRLENVDLESRPTIKAALE